MPRFCANLSMMFTELPFLDRFAAAADAGFQGVEYLFPFEEPASEIADRLRAHRLTQVLFNMPPGNWLAGERGIATLPDRITEFRDGVALAARYAQTLDCKAIHCMAGIAPADADQSALSDTYITNLRYAAGQLANVGARLLIEPINTRDMPGYFLTTTKQAMDVIDTVALPNLFLQYDCYHMQIMEGDLTPTIERLLPWIAHIQVADTPGRHEPGSGEINYPFVFQSLDRIGYDGWVGCEYRPKTMTTEGLQWYSRYATKPRNVAAKQ